MHKTGSEKYSANKTNRERTELDLQKNITFIVILRQANYTLRMMDALHRHSCLPDDLHEKYSNYI